MISARVERAAVSTDNSPSYLQITVKENLSFDANTAFFGSILFELQFNIRKMKFL